jgi:hypothetical protein
MPFEAGPVWQKTDKEGNVTMHDTRDDKELTPDQVTERVKEWKAERAAKETPKEDSQEEVSE